MRWFITGPVCAQMALPADPGHERRWVWLFWRDALTCRLLSVQMLTERDSVRGLPA
jgi:hypothetical protein